MGIFGDRDSKDNPEGRCYNCGAKIHFKDKICLHCLKPNKDWVTSGEGLCFNCHARVGTDSNYCSVCGTKVGEGEFKPFQNIMQCIYGPMPVKRVHTCKNCGYEWTTHEMIDKGRYCPKCGGPAPYEEVLDERD